MNRAHLVNNSCFFSLSATLWQREREREREKIRSYNIIIGSLCLYTLDD